MKSFEKNLKAFNQEAGDEDRKDKKYTGTQSKNKATDDYDEAKKIKFNHIDFFHKAGRRKPFDEESMSEERKRHLVSSDSREYIAVPNVVVKKKKGRKKSCPKESVKKSNNLHFMDLQEKGLQTRHNTTSAASNYYPVNNFPNGMVNSRNSQHSQTYGYNSSVQNMDRASNNYPLNGINHNSIVSQNNTGINSNNEAHNRRFARNSRFYNEMFDPDNSLYDGMVDQERSSSDDSDNNCNAKTNTSNEAGLDLKNGSQYKFNNQSSINHCQTSNSNSNRHNNLQYDSSNVQNRMFNSNNPQINQRSKIDNVPHTEKGTANNMQNSQRSEVDNIPHNQMYNPNNIPYNQMYNPNNIPHNQMYNPNNIPHNRMYKTKNIPHNRMFDPNNIPHNPRYVPHNRMFDPRNVPHNQMFDPRFMSHNRMFYPRNVPHNQMFDPRNVPHNRMFDPRNVPHNQMFFQNNSQYFKNKGFDNIWRERIMSPDFIPENKTFDPISMPHNRYYNRNCMPLDRMTGPSNFSHNRMFDASIPYNKIDDPRNITRNKMCDPHGMFNPNGMPYNRMVDPGNVQHYRRTHTIGMPQNEMVDPHNIPEGKNDNAYDFSQSNINIYNGMPHYSTSKSSNVRHNANQLGSKNLSEVKITPENNKFYRNGRLITSDPQISTKSNINDPRIKRKADNSVVSSENLMRNDDLSSNECDNEIEITCIDESNNSLPPQSNLYKNKEDQELDISESKNIQSNCSLDHSPPDDLNHNTNCNSYKSKSFSFEKEPNHNINDRLEVSENKNSAEQKKCVVENKGRKKIKSPVLVTYFSNGVTWVCIKNENNEEKREFDFIDYVVIVSDAEIKKELEELEKEQIDPRTL